MLIEDDESVIAMAKTTAMVDTITAATGLSTDSTTVPFANRTSKVTTRTMLIVYRSIPKEKLCLMRGARRLMQLQNMSI